MPETYNDDLWRESEQDDSSSSMDSYLYLESSNDTEIVTVPAEHVPRVYSEVEQMFQRELFMRVFRLVMAEINRETQDGGALPQEGGNLQHVDDTVDTQALDTMDTQAPKTVDTQAPKTVDTQALDTDTTPAPETAPIQYTDDTVDIVDTRAPDIQDTQATH